MVASFVQELLGTQTLHGTKNSDIHVIVRELFSALDLSLYGTAQIVYDRPGPPRCHNLYSMATDNSILLDIEMLLIQSL